MQKQAFQALLDKYLSGNCSAEERATLEMWYLTYEAKDLPPLSPAQLEEIRQSAAPHIQRTARRSWLRWAAAAAVLVAVAIGAYRYQANHDRGITVEQLAAGQDVAPGERRAFLTLANGRRIDLNEQQGGIAVDSLGVSYLDGTPVAGAAGTAETSALITMSTPKGGGYRVTLPDGTRVWLNAASSLRYPSRFAADHREVELTGEAFFEVQKVLNAANERIPFLVKTAHQTVRVLGTQFNVTAYTEETTEATTVVEGVVEVTATDAGKPARITPGEQALVQDNNVSKHTANLEQVTAWKNGNFFFDNEPLETVMRKISTWYDVTVVFEDAIAGEKFYGIIAREKKLSQVLKMLEKTKTVQFMIKGNTIHIYKR